MSILATGWGKCRAGELWGHVSAPLLCTQGVALGGAPAPLLSVAREAPGDRTQSGPRLPGGGSVMHPPVLLAPLLAGAPQTSGPTAGGGCPHSMCPEVGPAEPSPSHSIFPWLLWD